MMSLRGSSSDLGATLILTSSPTVQLVGAFSKRRTVHSRSFFTPAFPVSAWCTATLAPVLFVLARRHEIPQAKFDSSRSEGTRLDIVSAKPYTPETAHRSSNERYAAEELRKWRSGGRDDLIKDTIRSYRSNPALSGVPESVIIKQVDDSHAHAMRMISQTGASNFRKKFGDSPEPSRRQQP
jgi:hypothetical protein